MREIKLYQLAPGRKPSNVVAPHDTGYGSITKAPNDHERTQPIFEAPRASTSHARHEIFNALLAMLSAHTVVLAKSAWAPHGTSGGDEGYLSCHVLPEDPTQNSICR